MGLTLSAQAEWLNVNGKKVNTLVFSDINNFAIESYSNFIGPYISKNPYVSSIPFFKSVSWNSLLSFKNLEDFNIT